MKNIDLLGFLVVMCGFSGVANADIYGWTDENGVRHYSNFAPPEKAAVVEKTEELPYKGPSEADIREAERIANLLAAQQESAEKEADLLRKQQAAERKIAAANRKAEQVIQAAEDLLDEAREKYNRPVKKTYVYYGHYPYIRHQRKHVRKKPPHDNSVIVPFAAPYASRLSEKKPMVRRPVKDRGRFGGQAGRGQFVLRGRAR